MPKSDVELKILVTTETAERLESAARQQDVSVSVVVHEALRRYLDEIASSTSTPQVSSSQEISEMRVVLEGAVNNSGSWRELQEKLGEYNLELIPKGGGLSLAQKDPRLELYKPSNLGFPYSKLIKHFGESFPGHSHEWLAERVLSRKSRGFCSRAASRVRHASARTRCGGAFSRRALAEREKEARP
jgi:hypothetical protein